MPASTTLRVSVAVLGILAVVVVAYLATAVSVFQHDVDVAITSTPPEPLTPGYLPIYAAFGDSVDAAAFTAEPATQTSYYQNYLVAPTCSVNPDEIYAVAAPTSVEVLAIDLEGDTSWTVSATAVTIDELPYLVWSSDHRQDCAVVAGKRISLTYGQVTETFDVGLLTHQASASAHHTHAGSREAYAELLWSAVTVANDDTDGPPTVFSTAGTGTVGLLPHHASDLIGQNADPAAIAYQLGSDTTMDRDFAGKPYLALQQTGRMYEVGFSIDAHDQADDRQFVYVMVHARYDADSDTYQVQRDIPVYNDAWQSAGFGVYRTAFVLPGNVLAGDRLYFGVAGQQDATVTYTNLRLYAWALS